MKKARSMDYMGAVLGFKKVYDMQSYSKASKVLKISQPALSKRVNNLESMYGTPLLLKKSGTLELTRVGKILYEEAEQLEKINLATKKKIKKCINESVKQVVGINEDLYLNFVKGQEHKEYEYVVFDNEQRLRKQFENRQVDAIIITGDNLNRFAHTSRELYSQVDLLCYLNNKNYSNKLIGDEFTTMNQLIYQRSNMGSLLTEFLHVNNLLSNNFEYVEDEEVACAKIIANNNTIYITTSQADIEAKYNSMVTKVDYPLPTIELHMLRK